MKSPIATWQRFLYLNAYAILLFSLGVMVLCVPLWKHSLWWLIPQGIAFILFARGGLRILQSWDEKKRQYDILVNKNTKTFRPDTFKEYMAVPCGRLLTIVVLNDLGQRNMYKSLLKYKQLFIVHIIKDCTEKPKYEIFFFNNQEAD